MRVFKVFLVIEGLATILWETDAQKELKVTNGSKYFADVVCSPFFVDKTLLIKEFLNEHFSGNKPKVVSVLTPPGFGKTVNNNMIKLFLEAGINGKDERQEVKLRHNYKVFKENKLNIFKDETFNKHFGKHPVVSLNCKPLSEVTNFDHMVVIFRGILKSSFSEHKYLLSVDQLWESEFNKSSFELYFDENNDSRLHKYYIFCGFSILCEVLHVHYGKPPFVLIDDFDAIEDCPAFVTGEDKRRIFNFVKEVHGDLLVDNEHFAAALLTGSLRAKKEGKDKARWELNKVECSPTLWKYYGLSKEELESLLSKFVQGKVERKKLAENLVNNFTTGNQNLTCFDDTGHHLCSIQSVKQYFARNNYSRLVDNNNFFNQ